MEKTPLRKNKKKVGIIADADSIYIKKYIEYVLLPLKMEFVIFSNTNSKFSDYYAENNVSIVDYSVRKCSVERRTYFDKLIDSVNLLLVCTKKVM